MVAFPKENQNKTPIKGGKDIFRSVLLKGKELSSIPNIAKTPGGL